MNEPSPSRPDLRIAEEAVSMTERWISGDHRAQLISDGIHAGVVLVVVLATSIMASLHAAIPPDVVGTVFGGAIGYAAGRAGNIARSRAGVQPRG